MPSSSLTWNNKSTGAQNTKSAGARRSLWRFFQFRIGPWRVGPTILDRYILNEIAQPFLIFLLFFTVLFVSIALKDVIGDLLSKGIDPLKIGEFLSYLVLENLTVTLPVACLFAGILAAGRLSGDSEITALRAAGVSFPRIYIIFVFAGILSGACVLVMNFWVGPINAKAREDFQDWLNTYHSLSLVRPGRFLGRPNFDGLSTSGQDIYAERREGNVLKNVQIRKWHSELDLINSEKVEIQGQQIGIGAGFITQIIHADSGELLSRYTGEGEPEKFIRFSDGYLIELDEKQSGYQVTNFENGYLDYVIPPPPKPLGRLNVNATNFTFFELIDYINKLRDGGFEINP
ncbi:MAG: LptF/LptG family permease, partial [Leptospiraceae bacterium]|nr:LptF/LptG family permease [Leptospiraceae bacterium]